MRTVGELMDVLTGQCLWNSHRSCVLSKLPNKASCPPGHVSEMWQLRDVGRQIPLTVTAVLRGQGPALTHMWASERWLAASLGPLGKPQATDPCSMLFAWLLVHWLCGSQIAAQGPQVLHKFLSFFFFFSWVVQVSVVRNNEKLLQLFFSKLKTRGQGW